MSCLSRQRPASPSKLAAFRACPLRYLLETESKGERACRSPLGVHPATLLGAAVHEAADAFSGRKIEGAEAELLKLVESNFGSLLDSRSLGPVGSWIMTRFGASALVSRKRLIEQAAFANTLVARFPISKGSAGAVRGSDPVPLGTERWLSGPSSRVAGRVDLIYRGRSRGIHIVDFKTGRVTDEDGNPKDEYLLQMAAYGLIVRELDPLASISLELVGRRDGWSGDFDEGLAGVVELALDELERVLPLGVSVSPEDIARVGDHCTQCSFRPLCVQYKASMWERMATRTFDFEAWPLDIVGELLELELTGDLATIRCRLANGYVARISGIPANLVAGWNCREGLLVEAYALGAMQAARPGSFPCNFSIVDLASPSESAFRAYVCLGTPPAVSNQHKNEK